MAGSVAAERILWLNLTEIREKEKVFLRDAPISQTGLFGEAVSSVVEKFRSAKSQLAALKQFMPRRMRDHSKTLPPHPCPESAPYQGRSPLEEAAPRLYQGYRFGFSAKFGLATYFSLAETPLASTGFTWQ